MTIAAVTANSAVHHLPPNRGVSRRIQTLARPQHQSVNCRALEEDTSSNNGSVPSRIALTASRQFHDANFPTDGEGRTFHLGTKAGEVAHRILSVGSAKRADLLTCLLDPAPPGQPNLRVVSDRGFVTTTGCFQGTPVSIVTTMMGMANMDFVVRENRAVVDGPMAIIRLGTCGSLQPAGKLGSFVVASQGSVCIRRNPDAFGDSPLGEPYEISMPVPADEALSQALAAELRSACGDEAVVEAMNATADSFFSSQGRLTAGFGDRNEALLTTLLRHLPSVVSLEMESFHLLDLARCSGGSVSAAAVAIVLAERQSNRFMDSTRVEALEMASGRACLHALVQWQPQNSSSVLMANGLPSMHHESAGMLWHRGSHNTVVARSVARLDKT